MVVNHAVAQCSKFPSAWARTAGLSRPRRKVLAWDAGKAAGRGNMRAGLVFVVGGIALASSALADPVRLCSQQTDPGVAIVHCSRAVEASSGREAAWALNNRALAHAANGAYLEALADYDRAIATAPDFAPAWSNRGNAHAALGDMLKARADHEKALELDPGFIAARHNLAVDLEELGRYADALATYREGLKRAPNHKGSRIGLATASCKLGRVKTSAEARLEAIGSGALDAVGMQRMLQSQGYYRGAIDGIFGKGSRAALWAWTRAGCLASA